MSAENAFAEMAKAVADAAPENLPQEAPAPETKAPVPEPVSVPTPAESSAPAPAAPQPENTNTSTQAESLQRIKEIKSLVNEKVGNPVNLVDINNEVGREYMAALLDAMKKINSGSSAASAMQRLETAYSSVESALKDHDAAEKSAEAKVAPTPTLTPTPETNVPASPQIKSEPAVSPAQSAAPSEPQKAPSSPTFSPISVEQTKSIETEQAMDSRPIVPLTQSEPVGQKTVPVQPTPAPSAQPVAPEVKSSPEQPSSSWGPETDELPKPAAAPAPIESKVEQQQVATPTRYQSASLAESPTKLRTPADLPNASALETSSVAGDPLFTKQVDDGLNQLLSDWVLFKKSGLFGTGPKGMSHPLYLKIKDLQIPLLLAGRFEGATQEIKQSVTDYMNGWRYEQGIIYEQGETFDHYLRRVIRHILDLQKNL